MLENTTKFILLLSFFNQTGFAQKNDTLYLPLTTYTVVDTVIENSRINKYGYKEYELLFIPGPVTMQYATGFQGALDSLIYGHIKQHTLPEISYPPLMKEMGYQGTVAAELHLNPNGQFKVAGIAKPVHDQLNEVVLKAALKLEENPFRKSLKTAWVIYLPIRFVLVDIDRRN